MKVLLLENIHPSAVDIFKSNGLEVISLKNSPSHERLSELLPLFDIVCLRSKTRIPKELIEKNKHLKAIGCFCIGTDQVDVTESTIQGIPVFHSPFSNTRSVAELALCEIIALSRRLFVKSTEVHSGIWNKSAQSCYEIRGKTLGIIGYGHIGTQLGILAENMGMKVIFYDIVPKLSLGNSKAVELDELLSSSDFISLHVPFTEKTKNMINKETLDKMKKGAYLLNLSRGKVINIPHLVEHLGNLGGCALDVYPEEPEENGKFYTELQGKDNVILTPHIAGSTEESQELIGIDVSLKIINYIKKGDIQHSVNFPSLITEDFNHRILVIHSNQKGVLKKIHQIISQNISNEVLRTHEQIGYVVIDLDNKITEQELLSISQIEEVKSVRVI